MDLRYPLQFEIHFQGFDSLQRSLGVAHTGDTLGPGSDVEDVLILVGVANARTIVELWQLQYGLASPHEWLLTVSARAVLGDGGPDLGYSYASSDTLPLDVTMLAARLGAALKVAFYALEVAASPRLAQVP